MRNALDHGIEEHHARAATGKPCGGRGGITTAREDDTLRIEITDDGRGVACDRFAEAAHRKGLPTATREDLEAALFSDGVSIAAVVTDICARGIGTAAVAAEVCRLGGTTTVESQPGRGTTFRFVVPLRPVASSVVRAA